MYQVFFVAWFLFKYKFTFKKLYLEREKIIKELLKRINKRYEEIIELKGLINRENTDREVYKAKLAKTAKNLHLTRRYFEDNSIYFSEEIITKFQKLYARLQASLTSSGDALIDHDIWKEARQMREDLEKEFRKLLGVK